MKILLTILMGFLLIGPPLNAEHIALNKKSWRVLGFFDCENAELESICEYNINQLEEVDSAFAKIVVAYDRTYRRSWDSSVRIYDISHDSERAQIISNSSDELLNGISAPSTRDRYLTALRNTLQTAFCFQPLGRNSILTHYDLEDFLSTL